MWKHNNCCCYFNFHITREPHLVSIPQIGNNNFSKQSRYNSLNCYNFSSLSIFCYRAIVHSFTADLFCIYTVKYNSHSCETLFLNRRRKRKEKVVGISKVLREFKTKFLTVVKTFHSLFFENNYWINISGCYLIAKFNIVTSYSIRRRDT